MKTNGNDPITAIKDVGFDVDTESIAFDPSKADFRVSFGGLTKREYFAVMALSGILSSRGLQEALNADRTNWHEEAVEQADKLIEALNKENK